MTCLEIGRVQFKLLAPPLWAFWTHKFVFLTITWAALVVHITYIMATRDSPDIYVCALGRAWVYILGKSLVAMV